MTTNHPEKLDPALIRPGRIDKILHLGALSAAPHRARTARVSCCPSPRGCVRRVLTVWGYLSSSGLSFDLCRPSVLDSPAPSTGYVRSACAAAMIEHYFGAGAVQPVHREQLQRLLDGSGPGGPSEPRRAGRAPSSAQLDAAVAERCLEMTPAQLEQQCSEHESVGELLRALHVRREQCVD